MIHWNCDIGKAYVPIGCHDFINTAVKNKHSNQAHNLYPNMPLITGVLAKHATYEDFQRLFYCKKIKMSDCYDKGLQFPRSCSHPPCDRCTVDIKSKLNKTLSELSKQ